MIKSVSLLAKAIIVSIILMIFGEAFGVTLLGASYRLMFIVLNVILLGIYVFMVGRVSIGPLDRYPLFCAVVSWVLFLISFLGWDYTHNAYSYIGITVAFLVYLLDFRFANRLLLWLVVLELGLTAYEFFTHKFLFINTVHGIEYDERFLGGMLGTFRAKGFFYGPTVVGIFMVMAFLLNNNKLWVLLCGIVACFFANSRMGVLLLLCAFVIMLLHRKSFKVLIISVLLLGIGLYLLYQYVPHVMLSLERFEALDNMDNQSERIYYWREGIRFFSNYDFGHLIFGNNGAFSYQYNNNPESGWICLLTDNGILGFLFYLLPLIYAFYRFLMRKEFYLFAVTGIFFVMNFLITSHLSGTGNLVYWLVVFELVNKARFGYGKLDNPIRDLQEAGADPSVSSCR